MGLLASILAAFVTPALFFGGACAAAIPIIIHLLARRRFRRIRWAAIEFLVDAEKRNRRRIRMEEWVLLALRCAAVVLICLALARPFFSPRGMAFAFGDAQRTERVFVLDDSFSMGYRPESESVFDRGKRAVRRLLEVVRREAPQDTVTLIRMTAVDNPVETGKYLDDAQASELLERLNALAPSQRTAGPRAVIEGVAELLANDPGIVNAAVYVISDFQRHDWAPTRPEKDGSDEEGILAPLAEWAGSGRALRPILVNVGEEGAANTAVTDLQVQARQLVAGNSAVLRATLANHGDAPVENIEVEISVGQFAAAAKRVPTLAGRKTASLDLEVEFPRPGSEEVSVRVPLDALPIDNVRYLAPEITSAIRILVVNGEPAADSYGDEMTLLATALRPEGEVFSGNELTIVDELEFEETNLAEYHVVILANVYRPGPRAVQAVERFVQRGGGVIIFLGDQVDADAYNAELYRGGEGPLPAEIGEIAGTDEGAHLVISDRLHPALRGVSAEGDPLGLGRVAFLRYFACVPFGMGAVEGPVDDGHLGESVSAAARRPARTVARFDDADENPAIIERRFGRGRVLLITTSADKEWHYWPDHPTFLPVMMELVSHVARPADVGGRYIVGTPIELDADPALFEADVSVRTPAYPAEREFTVTAAPAADGRGHAVTWEHTDAAGVYRFVLKRREGGDVVRLAAVNVDPRESDLSTVDADELRRSLGPVPFEYVRGVEDLFRGPSDARSEFWRSFVLAAACLLMVEQFLAWRWGRRR